MSVYREPGVPGVVPLLGQRMPATIRLIDEAWTVLRERRDAHVGPEPAWWRIFARMAWRDRKRDWEYATPGVVDVLDASERINADWSTVNRVLEAIEGINRRRR